MMKRADFLLQLESIMELELGSIKGDENLDSFGGSWSSLSMLAFIAFVDEKCGLVLTPDSVARSKSVADLVALLGSKIEG